MEATSVLLDRLRHGDPAAAEELFGRLLPVLRKWAAGRLPSHARDLLDTQDLVQDTIVRTLQHLSTFEDRGTGALAAYLRQAIINRIRDETRRAARRGARMALETGVADGGPSPLQITVDRATFERYERALDRLRPDQREAILLRFEMGLSYEEVGAALGRPSLGATRKRLERAVLRLAELMADERA